jgi:hypothetical protein
MKSKIKNTRIILSIAFICLVVIMSVFVVRTRFGIDFFLVRVVLLFVGILGIFIVWEAVKHIIKMIKWIIKKIKNRTHNNI